MVAKKLLATIEFLSLCPKRGVKSEECQSLELALDGIVGDRHFGFVKKADGRDTGIKRGTLIRNWRQWSAVSQEELDTIAERLDISALDPALLGANICFSGLPGFTQLPPATTITFPDGAILKVEAENAPCILPGKEIAKVFNEFEPKRFAAAAMHLRGLVGVVHAPGKISRGDTAVIKFPQ